MPKQLGAHALVIGGSLAGLMAARVLADHFQQVTIVERDGLPDTAVPRAGVPQAQQWHGLMARGYRIMQALYPDLTARLLADGIPLPDSLRDYIVFGTSGAGYLPRWPSGIHIPVCSRTRLEWHVRQLTLARPNITAVCHAAVLGLLANETKTAVNGVQIRYRRNATHSGTAQLTADLVVDASGRHTRIDQWLTAQGWTPPPQTRIETAVHYATRFYRPTAPQPDWNGLIVTMQFPHNARFGGLRTIEDGLWQVALAGMNGERPPTDDTGYAAYAAQLASPIIAQALETAVAITPALAYHSPWVCRRHVDRLRQPPRRLLMVGDALCAYNPLYGQGMTSAAVCAEQLQEVLAQRSGLDGVETAVHKQLVQATNQLWQQATRLDRLWQNPDPQSWTVTQRLLHRISAETLPLLMEDQALFLRGTQVRHLLAPVWTGVNGRFVLRLLGRLVGMGAPGAVDLRHPKLALAAATEKPIFSAKKKEQK